MGSHDGEVVPMVPPTLEERHHAMDALLRWELTDPEVVDSACYKSYASKLVAALKVEIGTAFSDPAAAARALEACAKIVLLVSENASKSLEFRRIKRTNRAFATRVGRWTAALPILVFLDFTVGDHVVTMPTPCR